MFEWVLGNTLVAALFALVAFVVSRIQPARPALSHLLWVVALGALMMPRLPGLHTPGSELRQHIQSWVAPAIDAVPATAQGPTSTSPVDAYPISAEVLPVGTAPSHGAASARTSSWPGLPTLPVETWLALAWSLGALFVLVKSVARVVPFQRHVRASASAPIALQREVGQVSRRFGLPAPAVRILPGIVSPSIWCLGRPLLLWPSTPDLSDSSSARSTLIAHELAHLARRDHWVSWLDVPASALFWWNPLFWLIRGRIRHFAELSCDAWAVWAYPVDRRAFAEALIDLQARTTTVPIPAQGLGATDSEFKDFERRLNMIMKKRVARGVSKGAVAAALIASFLASPGLSDGMHAGKKKSMGYHTPTKPAAIQAHVEVTHMMKKAEGLLARGNQDEALALFAKVQELDPDNGRAYERVGHTLLKLGEYKGAAKQFKRQFMADYARPTALYNLACASALGGERETSIEALTHAVGHGFANIDLMASDSDLDAIRGQAAFQELMDRAAAGKALKEALRTAKDVNDEAQFLHLHGELARILSFDGELLSTQGHMSLKAGELEEAAWAFARQVEVGHQVSYGYYNLACALARMGKADGAIEMLAKAREAGMAYEPITRDSDLDSLRSDPRFTEIQDGIVASGRERMELKQLLESGSTAEVLPRLKKIAVDAGRSSKERGWAIHALGRELLKQERYEDALAAFEHAAEEGYGIERSAYHQAQALTAMGNLESAYKHLAYAVELGFDDPELVDEVLASNSYCSDADAAKLVERAAKAKAKDGYDKKDYKKNGYVTKDAAAKKKKELAAYGGR